MEYNMFRYTNLLENIKSEIDKNLCGDINTEILAKKYTLSEGHLRRLFRYAYNRTIANYIRSRKLTVSLNDLLKSNITIIDIAMKYGFDYEQSYIRAFKREFGITPGGLRKISRNRSQLV
jgi:AraC family transcriptional regulator